jgi:hypothetical protein
MLGLAAALPAQADPELDFTIPDSNPKATVTYVGGKSNSNTNWGRVDLAKLTGNRVATATVGPGECLCE